MARTIRQREDDKSKWDVLEEGPGGRPSISVVDTATAARLQKAGDTITDSASWGEAFKAAEERAGVLSRGGAGTPGMVHALDENEEPVVASLDTVRKRGWEVVSPEQAAQAGEAFSRRRDVDQTGQALMPDRPASAVAEMRSGMGLSGPMPPGQLEGGLGASWAPSVERRGFRPLSGEALAQTEAGVRNFVGGLNSVPAQAPQAPRARPGVSVQTAGAAAPMRDFQPLAGLAPDIAGDVEGIATNTVESMPQQQAGDAEFAAAQDLARQRRLAAGIGRAGAMANQAFSGVGFDEDIYSGAGVDPVRELLARREADKAKSLSDPDSEQSIRFRAAVQKAMPGVYAPEELASMTAADEPLVMRYGDMRQRMDERAAGRTREDELRRAEIARQDALRSDERAYQERQTGASRTFQAGESARQRAFQREMAGLNNAADLAQAQARSGGSLGGAARGTVVPGLEIEPGAAPTADDAKTVKKARESSARMRSYVTDLRNLHAKYGTEYGGEAGNRMRQLAKAIQIEAKNIAGLGALTGSDQQLMEDLAGFDPSTLGSNLKSFLSLGLADNTQSSLDQLEKWVGDSESAAMSVHGYRPVPSASPQAAAAQASSQPQRIQRGGKTYELENGQWFEVL